MTKEQLMQFIEVDSEEDKDDCEFYARMVDLQSASGKWKIK